jgi:hypothetical protein
MQRGEAMGAVVAIRTDHPGRGAPARQETNGRMACRLMALANATAQSAASGVLELAEVTHAAEDCLQHLPQALVCKPGSEGL